LKLRLTERASLAIGRRTQHLGRLPVLVLMPHSRCNCRCVMCDIWRANANGRELTEADLEPHIDGLRELGVRWITLSGGEALMHRNLFGLCEQLRPLGTRISLLSTGLLLRKFAKQVVAHTDDVIVSLDGSPAVHDAIRNVPRAFERLADGIAALREVRTDFRVTARCVLQRGNYRDLPAIIETAKDLRLDQLSFLPADCHSEAFNRPGGWDAGRAGTVALSAEEAGELERMIAAMLPQLTEDNARGFLAESPRRMAGIAQYCQAVAGRGEFPAIRCNAPWVSAVIEADGAVRPCYFHPAYGSLRDGRLKSILNSPTARAFRRNLDPVTNPVCRRCVCTLKL
jgi:MoaA/NifB/PqqE/SkfB family radical SAM enzyme